VQNKSCCFKNI